MSSRDTVRRLLRLYRTCPQSLSSFIAALSPSTVQSLLYNLRHPGSNYRSKEVFSALSHHRPLRPRLICAATAAMGVLPSSLREELLAACGEMFVELAKQGQQESLINIATRTVQEAERERLRGVETVEVLVECARAVAMVEGGRGLLSAAKLGTFLLKVVMEKRWGIADGSSTLRGLLALLSPGMAFGQRSEQSLKRLAVEACKLATGRDPEVVTAVNAVVMKIKSSADKQWVSVLRQMARQIRSAFFGDILCIIELEIADEGALALGLVRECETLLECKDDERSDSLEENEFLGDGRISPSDVAILLSIIRSSPHELVRKRAYELLLSISSIDGSRLDVAGIAGGSQISVEDQLSHKMLFRGCLALSGLEQRVSSAISFCEQLIWSGDERLRDWGVEVLQMCFSHFEAVRSEVLDRALSSMVEQGCSEDVRNAYCCLVELLAHPEQLHEVKAYSSTLVRWLSFVTVMPTSLALRVTVALSRLAIVHPSFFDKFITWLRKLALGKQYTGRQIAGTGLCALLEGQYDEQTCDEVITSLIELVQNASLPLRSELLHNVCPILRRHMRLRNAVTDRLTLISDGPLRLNSCFVIEDGLPMMVDAVPSLVRCAISLQELGAAERLHSSYYLATQSFRALLEYISNPTCALSDAFRNQEGLDDIVEARVTLEKLKLLLCLCEILMANAKLHEDFERLMQIYAVTAVVTTGVESYTKKLGVTNERLHTSMTAKKDMMTAREVASSDFNQSMILRNHSRTSVDDKVMLGILEANGESMLARCAAATSILQKADDFENSYSDSTKRKVVLGCLRLFAESHPWMEKRTSRVSCGVPRISSSDSKTRAAECLHFRSEKGSSYVTCPTRVHSRASSPEYQNSNDKGEPTDSMDGGQVPPNVSSSDPSSEIHDVVAGRARNRSGHDQTSINLSSLSSCAQEDKSDKSCCFRRAALALVDEFRSKLSGQKPGVLTVALSSLLSGEPAKTAQKKTKDGATCTSSNQTRASSVSTSCSTSSAKSCVLVSSSSLLLRMPTLLEPSAVLASCRTNILLTLGKLIGSIPFEHSRWRYLENMSEQATSETLESSIYCPLVACFEREFEHSMSLSLAMAYTKFLSLLNARAESLHECTGKSAPGPRAIVSAILRILNSYVIGHAKLLRSLLLLLFQNLPIDSCASLLLSIGSVISFSSFADGSSDTDGEDIRLNNDSIPPDILRLGLIMDGVLPAGCEADNDDNTKSSAYSDLMKRIGKSKETEGQGLIRKSVICSWKRELESVALASALMHLQNMLVHPSSNVVLLAISFLETLYEKAKCDPHDVFSQSSVLTLVGKILAQGRKALGKCEEGTPETKDMIEICSSFARGKVARISVEACPRLALARELLLMDHHMNQETQTSDEEYTGFQRPGAMDKFLPYKRGRRGRDYGRRVRSRNKVIDEWLAADNACAEEAIDDDDYADMEDFIVDIGEDPL